MGAYALHRSVRTAQGNTGEVRPADRPVLLPAAGKRFDALFRRWGNERSIPPAYLRALAARESNLNPSERDGSAWGLLQVRQIVVEGFNRHHGTTLQHMDMLDAKRNVEVASWQLRTIVNSYQRNHPLIGNLQEDWTNPRFVELVTFGWNAGWSERGGVGRVARYLERRGQTAAVTIDLIHDAARAAGAASTLSRADKVRWCKGVVRIYMSERLRGPIAARPAA